MTKTLIHDEKAHLMVVRRAVSVSVGTGSVSVRAGGVSVATGSIYVSGVSVSVSGTTISTVVGRGGAVSGVSVSVSVSASRDDSHQGSQTQQRKLGVHLCSLEFSGRWEG